MAANNENEPTWDLSDDGIGLELTGDSLLICNWINGLWKIEGGEGGDGASYRRRVANIISLLEGLEEEGVRPPSWGHDFIRHIYRESNTVADELTHLAREGQIFRELFHHHVFRPDVQDNFRVIGLRGSFDGGVCAQGVGVGWFLQIGYIPRFHDPYPASEHRDKRARVISLFPQASSPYPVIWEVVGRCAQALPAHSSITDAELSGLEGLLRAAAQVAQDLRLQRETR